MQATPNDAARLSKDTSVVSGGDVWIRYYRVWAFAVALASIAAIPSAQSAQSIDASTIPSIKSSPRLATTPAKELMTMSDQKPSTGDAEAMRTAAALTTKVLAIGTWTAKATPETRPPIMPAEARDTLRLMLAGKIDQWFAKTDGSGAVFLLNVTDPAEAHAFLEKLPLGQADMMRFDIIPVGPLWPMGLLLHEPAK
jgi:hypothetical protein